MKHPIAFMIKKLIEYHVEVERDEQIELDFNNIDYIIDYDDYLGNIDYVTNFRETYFLLYLHQQKYID